MLGLIMTEAKEGTGATRVIITNSRTLRDIITDGKRVKGTHTGTATNIAGCIGTGMGMGIIETTRIDITKDTITTSA
jgi:hypothetical protein